MVEYYEARVLFDYIPTTSDELCLRAGEYIEVRVDPNDLDGGEQGWLSGSDLRGCHGVFPANYVLDLRTVGADVSDAPAPEHDTDATVDSTFIRGRPEAMEREDMAIQGGQLGADRDVATGDRGAPSLRNNLPANNRDAVTLSNSDSAAGLEGTATTPPTALVGGAYDTRTERGTAAVASSGEDTVSAAQVDDGSTHKPVAANGEPQGPSPNDDNVDRLPDGWFSAVDEASGVVYYYTEGGPSSWTRPVAVQTPPHTHEATIGETVNAANENCATNSGLITASNSSYSEVSADEQDREAQEQAAVLIQSIARGKHARRQAGMPNVQNRTPAQSVVNDPREGASSVEARENVVDQDRPANNTEWGGGGPVEESEGRVSGGACAAEAAAAAAGAAGGLAMDGETAKLIASLVDERLMEELHRRDAVLSDIQATVTTLTSHRVAGLEETTQQNVHDSSPARLRRKPPSPVTPKATKNSKGRVTTGTFNVLDNLNARLVARASPTRVSPGRNQNLRPVPSCSRSCPPMASRRPLGGGGALLAAERSPSPPSRSQPLRALARGAVSTHVSYDDGDDDVGFGAAEDEFDTYPEHGVRGGHGDAKSVYGAAGATNPLPRVADVEGVHRLALAKHRAKAVEAAALVKSPCHGRTVLYHPSWYDPNQANTSTPDSNLSLEYVYGYAGETPEGGSGGCGGGGGGVGGGVLAGKVGGARNSATRSTNVMWLRTGELVFPASAVVVMHDFEANRQRFFTGHDEEVTALAVHPYQDIVVSGQAGKEAIVCLFDASHRPEVGRRERKRDHDAQLAEGDLGGYAAGADGAGTPFFLRELSLGKKERRGVAALDFSSDGNLILAMAGGDGQVLSVWDWRRGVRLASARAEAAFLSAISVRFNPWLFLEGSRAEAAGLSPGDACYTLVSCGHRHVRFWTLTRERYLRRSGGGAGGDNEGRETEWDGGSQGWAWALTSKPGNFGDRGEIDNMTCMAFIGEPWVGSEGPRQRGIDHSLDYDARLPVARAITGADNGRIYFWEVAEQNPQQPLNVSGSAAAAAATTAGGGRRIGWKPQGRLLAVVPKAHDGPLTDMCYLQHGTIRYIAAETKTGQPSEGAEEWGRLATCGGEGTLRLWGVAGEGPSPLQLLLTVEVSSRGVGIGHPRSVSWDRSGTTLALGTVGNAVCLVQPVEDTERGGVETDGKPERRRGVASVMFMLAVQGHTGTCKALAPHPTRPWFVTGGTDRVLRLWDARSRRQLSAARLLEKVCSASFHPAGDVLAVGNESGDFFLMALRAPSSVKDGDRQPSQAEVASVGFSWDVLARKRIVVGGAGSTSRVNRAHSPPNGSNNGKKEANGSDGDGAGIRSGVGESFHSSARAADHRDRKSKPTAGGGSIGCSRYHATGRPPGDTSLSPRLNEKNGFSARAPAGTAEGGGVSATSAATAATSAAVAAPTTMEVNCLRFSPDGEVLAAACGSFIHLYREAVAAGRTGITGRGGNGGRAAYRRYGVCTGHGTKVRSFDFSRDGSVLQSNDFSGELLFWEVSTGRQITNGFSVRDLEMDSWSCPVGWPAQGLAGVAAAGGGGGAGVAGGGAANRASYLTGGILAVCRSNAGDVMAISDEDSCVSLVRNPAPEGAAARANWGHTSASGVSGLAFLCDDRRLVSSGGTCAFVWRHVQPQLHPKPGGAGGQGGGRAWEGGRGREE